MKYLMLAGCLLAFACKNNNPEPEVIDGRRVDAVSVDTAPDSPATCFDPAGTPPGCFLATTCTQQQDADFLNACTDASCVHFDNAARLPLYNNGNLPAIP